MTWENFSQHFPLLPIVMNAGRYRVAGSTPIIPSTTDTAETRCWTK